MERFCSGSEKYSEKKLEGEGRRVAAAREGERKGLGFEGRRGLRGGKEGAGGGGDHGGGGAVRWWKATEGRGFTPSSCCDRTEEKGGEMGWRVGPAWLPPPLFLFPFFLLFSFLFCFLFFYKIVFFLFKF